MTGRFEDFWSSAADDGASSPIDPYATRLGVEIDQLMSAWYRERTAQIECDLLLDQAEGLIDKILIDGDVSPRRRREAIRFLRASRKVRSLKKENDDD
jgi:hypothetical protein